MFPKNTLLQEHKRRMVEAKRRDHRVLGKKLDLFSLQEDAGGGLVSAAQDPQIIGARLRKISSTTRPSTLSLLPIGVIVAGVLRQCVVE